MGKKKPKSKKPALKSLVSASESSSSSEMDLIAAALSATNTVFMKVCRLCESKDGPFINIFDAEKVTARKIDELMPFKIAENDDLPHKICFRCSAKVEELYEFIQKCIKTQHNLQTALGKKEPVPTKTKTRAIWEEKLNKSNISNDDICDALIKKAMEGIKDIPLNPAPLVDEEAPSSSPVPLKKETKVKTKSSIKKEVKNNEDTKSDAEDDDKDMSLKQLKLSLGKCNDVNKFIPTRVSRSQNPEALLDGLPDYKRNFKNPTKKQPSDSKQNEQESSSTKKSKKNILKVSSSEDESSSDVEIKSPPREKEEEKPVETPKPFDIMDHVSIIKVNGVGVLFQCKLCNRNFLKKEIVQTHGCAKTGGVPRPDFTKNIVQPEPPKPPAIKYINTKTDGELGKPVENKTVTVKTELEVQKPVPETKRKPRIGPASKVKRNESNPMIGMTVAPIVEPPEPAPPPPEVPPVVPSVQFPSIPSLNSRYKLVPGPNNTFQLVEESSANVPVTNVPVKSNTEGATSKSSKKRKSDGSSKELKHRKQNSPEIIDLETSNSPAHTQEKNSTEQPYPVGLFSTLPHHSSVYPPSVVPEPTFTTPAMKKQSYTIVQTGNPSKLLISTKPQPPVEEPSKKRQKRSKHDPKADTEGDKQPFKVTLEDSVPPPKDSFFTFINVDPLLQPSYVLPTDNIIQESQISTSTPASKSNLNDKDKDKYSCNMCDETFTREKKLLAHIHSHYTKMDEEDLLREKNSKRRGKK